jgi:RNA polymerase sigma factor (sigma-70 family)
MINKALEQLPEKQRNILKQIYIYGYNESEIARKLHISRQAVNKTKKKALENLKYYLIA